MSEVKYPNVTVQLTGEDGNIFSIMGRVSKALRRAGATAEINTFLNEVREAPSYDNALQVIQRWVQTK